MFENEVNSNEQVTHVKISMAPDGGIARVRLWGIPYSRA